jgi:hypothetical protein
MHHCRCSYRHRPPRQPIGWNDEFSRNFSFNLRAMSTFGSSTIGVLGRSALNGAFSGPVAGQLGNTTGLRTLFWMLGELTNVEGLLASQAAIDVTAGVAVMSSLETAMYTGGITTGGLLIGGLTGTTADAAADASYAVTFDAFYTVFSRGSNLSP